MTNPANKTVLITGASGLQRELRLPALTATGICAMLGASVYVVPFMIQRNVPGIGSWVLPAFLFAAVPALLAAFAAALSAYGAAQVATEEAEDRVTIATENLRTAQDAFNAAHHAYMTAPIPHTTFPPRWQEPHPSPQEAGGTNLIHPR